jgi:SsrA-binding protein
MSFKLICENRKAYHEYEILETFEAGLVLTGKEIKAIRAGKIVLQGSYAKIIESRIKNHESSKNKNHNLPAGRQGSLFIIPNTSPELFLLGAHIAVIDADPTRTRKILMHRKEIDHLIGKINEKNLTLIPTKIYLKDGKAKIELGLARGKKLHDKREVIKKRDLNRDKSRDDL